LSELARSEKDGDLRRAAIRSLGQMSTDKSSDTLKSIYLADGSTEVRRDIINSIAGRFRG
jgi:hypothetical protein